MNGFRERSRRGGPRAGDLGRRAERIAAHWILLLGWKLIDHHRRGGGGEIDLIARDGTTLVLIEVRCRRRGSWVGAAASIGRTKRSRLRACAAELLRRRDDLRWAGRRIRFDVIAICYDPEGERAGLELAHLRNVRL